jgi:oligopeptide/dipeptide ABC transporter ATP-binding protein
MSTTGMLPTALGAPPSDFVLSVRDLTVHFPIREGVMQRVAGHVRAVDGVSFDVRRGETVGLVGESGCGKTTLGRCIAGLREPTDGGVYFGMSTEAVDRLDRLRATEPGSRTGEATKELAALERRYRIDAMSRDDRRRYRRNCQMVFQDAFASLNPRHLVRDIVGRPLRIHHEASGHRLTERVVELLESVGLGRQHLFRYPHQFSGGQRQRISIARALALEPDFIVLDEPTSALDVSVQAQILNLLDDLQRDRGLTYLFVSHDLNVVRHMSDRIIVMYLGRLCEVSEAERLFGRPRHPYTEALLAANPAMEGERTAIRLSGVLPDPSSPPQGCRFHTRCPVVTTRCGWEIDDVIRTLEMSGRHAESLQRVERRSPFDADLTFGSPAEAAEVAAELTGPRTPATLRDAVARSDVSGPTLTIAFEPVVEVQLVPVEDGHASACVLEGGTTEPPTERLTPDPGRRDGTTG